MDYYNNIVRRRISEYLMFDVDEIFRHGDPIIFGGAVRDSIANQPIHDVDIITGSITTQRLKKFLESIGYVYLDSLVGKGVNNLYKDIKIIFEPLTFVRDGRIIQLIRPNNLFTNEEYSEYKVGLCNFISSVDISCCGVSYDGSVVERYPNAIMHCENKVFLINGYSKLMQYRLDDRIRKMVDRGWRKTNEIDERNLKIDHILNLA